VVVSLADWEAARAGRADKWARANAMLADLPERMREDGTLDRLKDVDWAEVIRDGRAQRDQQVWDALH